MSAVIAFSAGVSTRSREESASKQKFWEVCPRLARKGQLLMGLSAILIATALSLTMLVAVADLP
jgi:hypothetical protein